MMVCVKVLTELNNREDGFYVKLKMWTEELRGMQLQQTACRPSSFIIVGMR